MKKKPARWLCKYCREMGQMKATINRSNHNMECPKTSDILSLITMIIVDLKAYKTNTNTNTIFLRNNPYSFKKEKQFTFNDVFLCKKNHGFHDIIQYIQYTKYYWLLPKL